MVGGFRQRQSARDGGQAAERARPMDSAMMRAWPGLTPIPTCDRTRSPSVSFTPHPKVASNADIVLGVPRKRCHKAH